MSHACRGALCRAVSCRSQPAVCITTGVLPRVASGPAEHHHRVLSTRRTHEAKAQKLKKTSRCLGATSAVASGSTGPQAGPSVVGAEKQLYHEDRMQELVVFLRDELPRIFTTGVRSASLYVLLRVCLRICGLDCFVISSWHRIGCGVCTAARVRCVRRLLASPWSSEWTRVLLKATAELLWCRWPWPACVCLAQHVATARCNSVVSPTQPIAYCQPLSSLYAISFSCRLRVRHTRRWSRNHARIFPS